MTPTPRPWGRRQLLRSGAVAFGGAGAGWSASALTRPPEGSAPGADDVSSGVPQGNEIVAFHGAHQAGVATPAQASLSLLGLDLVAGVGRGGLDRLLGLLGDDASRLARGVPALADTEPELASRPARLTVTFGLGPRVVDRLLGRPELVAPLPRFSDDRLDPAWGQTDLVVQVCGDDPVTVAHARRMLLKDARDFVRVAWIQDGFRRARGTEPDGTTMRNLMGQVDGTANPVEADPGFGDLVWSQRAGFEGGTTMVVRRIRMQLDTWDRVDRTGREAAVGRTLDTGAPLTGTAEHDEPDFEARDGFGFPVIDPASHVARARHRTPEERFLRRAYNYTVPDSSRPTGEDTGLVFIGFTADPEASFVPVQRRLSRTDRLNEWVTTIGSAAYAVLPGVPEGGRLGASLLT